MLVISEQLIYSRVPAVTIYATYRHLEDHSYTVLLVLNAMNQDFWFTRINTKKKKDNNQHFYDDLQIIETVTIKTD